MVIFLLLIIIAILLLGAGAVMGALRAAAGFALLLLTTAIVFGVAMKVPTWCWWSLAALGGIGLIGIFVIFQQADEDSARLAASKRGETPAPSHFNATPAPLNKTHRTDTD